MSDPKILLCIPHGGLNDTLCQIEKCRDYAQRFGRDLHIDTRRSGLMGDFSLFFDVKPSAGVRCVTSIGEPMLVRLNAMSAYPVEVAGQIGRYKNRYCVSAHRQIDAVSGVILSFDFRRDYSEDVVVHEQDGGGRSSDALLSHLTFTAGIRDRVSAALATLPRSYEAIHVRHTDYKTNYVEFLAGLREQLTQKQVLVCSDNVEVIASARDILIHSTVLTVTQPPDLKGKPLHEFWRYTEGSERIEATARSLVDLAALANADSLHFTTVHRGFASGFSRLALYLHQNKHVLSSLLATPPDPQGPPGVSLAN